MPSSCPDSIPSHRSRLPGASWLLGGLLAAAACANEAPKVAQLEELASFQRLRYSSVCAPPPGMPCGTHIEIDRAGVIELEHNGLRTSGQLPEGDLTTVAELATSAAVVNEIRAERCLPGPDGGEGIEINVAPNLWVGPPSICGAGPVRTLVYRLYQIAGRLFPDLDISRSGSKIEEVPLARARIEDQVRFIHFSWGRSTSPCPYGPWRCPDAIGVESEPDGIRVRHQQRGARVDWKPVSDLSPLAEVAIRPDVIRELRQPGGCGPVTDLTEPLFMNIAPGLWLKTDIAGCNGSALTDLRAGARALVDRLAATPRAGLPDGGASDHPPDGR